MTTATAAMQRETIGLSVETVGTIAMIRRGLRLLSAAGDEGRQALGLARRLYSRRLGLAPARSERL